MTTSDFNIFLVLTPKSATHFFFENDTFRQALERFEVHKYTVVPIINENGEYVSSISEGDLLRHIKKIDQYNLVLFEKTRISEIEKYRSYKAININASFEEVYELILSQNFVPVVDDRNKYIGIIKRKDILLLLNSK